MTTQSKIVEKLLNYLTLTKDKKEQDEVKRLITEVITGEAPPEEDKPVRKPKKEKAEEPITA